MRLAVNDLDELEDDETSGSRDDSFTSYDSDNSDEEPVSLVSLSRCLPALRGGHYKFSSLHRIGKGTYGVVYRAQDKLTNETVALKRLKMERDGFPIITSRELKTLFCIQHENIVTLKEIVVSTTMDVFIVMEYIDRDLRSVMSDMESRNEVLQPRQVKYLLIQLLSAVAHLHDNWITHRDLKPSNILLTDSGILKVSDFGITRKYGCPSKTYTTHAVTLWYRAPELLLQCGNYASPIDMWSVGCIFAELLTLEPLFKGNSELGQLNEIFNELGTPDEETWPGLSELPLVNVSVLRANPLERFSAHVCDAGLELLHELLTYDPEERITAEEAKFHVYFQELANTSRPSYVVPTPANCEFKADKEMVTLSCYESRR